jgi:hypothetical protein
MHRMPPSPRSRPAPRHLTGALSSLVLLAWVLLVPGAVPPLIVHPGRVVNPAPVLLTALFAVVVLVKLGPLAGGRGRPAPAVRWAALVACAFPALLLLWIGAWAAGPGRGG